MDARNATYGAVTAGAGLPAPNNLEAFLVTYETEGVPGSVNRVPLVLLVGVR